MMRRVFFAPIRTIATREVATRPTGEEAAELAT